MKLRTWKKIEDFKLKSGVFISKKQVLTLEKMGLLEIRRPASGCVEVDSDDIERAEKQAARAEHTARDRGFARGPGRVSTAAKAAALLSDAHPASRLARRARAERDARQLALPLAPGGLK